MKKLKFGFSKFLCMILCAVMLFGCGKGTDGKETGNLPNQGDVSGQDANGQKPSGGTDVGVQDGGVQGDGNFSDGEGKNPADGEAGTNVPDQSDGFLKDGMDGGKTSPQGDGRLPQATVVADREQTFGLLTNYKEKNIPSVYEQGNGEEHYSNVCLDENQKIKYYTYSEDENGFHIWKYTLAEEVGENAENPFSWEREAVSWTEGIAKEIAHGEVKVFLGQDGKEYAWYLGIDEKAHFVKQDTVSSGDDAIGSFVEITGLDWGYTEFVELAVLGNGEIVSADLGKECSIYSQTDGSLLKCFPCGFYQGLCVDGNQIYIGEKTGTSVQHYDAEKKEFAATMQAGFDTTIRVAVQGNHVYVCTMTGIYCAEQSGGKFQKVLDAGTYHFAKNSGVLLKFFVVGDAFYILYGEDGGAIKKYSPAKEGDMAVKSLTVYSLKKNDVVLDMISEFQNIYPDVEILYETGEDANGSITASDGIRALNTRILAGDGPEVLVLDGLPVNAYIKKGILADLNPVLGEEKEELLPSILDAYTTEGKIYMLPARFSIPMFLTSGQEEEVYSSLKALVEYSEAEGGIMPADYPCSDYLEILYYNYPPEFILGDGTVDREKLEEFLGLVKRLCDSENALKTTPPGIFPYMAGRAETFSFVRGDADFAFANLNGGYSLGTYPSALELRDGELVSNGGMFFPNTLFGINRSAGEQEMAALFLKFAFSYEIQKRYVGLSGYQIHEKVLDRFAQLDLSAGCVSGDRDDLKLRYANREENDRMIQFVKEGVHKPFMVDESVWEIIKEEAMGYLLGEKKLADAVDAIAGRIQLYLYEQ